MKTESISPEFDERILTPSGEELVCPVYTMPLHEFRFYNYCKSNGLVSYLPLKKSWKHNNYTSKGRQYNYTRMVYRPMFPSYVFVKFTKESQQKLFASKSINHILPVADLSKFLEDVRTVRGVELAGLEQELEFNVGIAEGDRFVIESGAWAGVTGWLKKKECLYVWTVEIEFINQFVRAQIDPSKYKMRKAEV